MVENQRFEDAEGYSQNYGKDKITFRDIVLQHLRKISQFASVELRGGYWHERVIESPTVSNVVKTYVPDSREIYSNSVEWLADTLFPYFDDEITELEKSCKKNIDDAYQNFKGENDKHSYREERLKINKILFRGLCSFLYRKKYLELGDAEDK